jgi:hypothetical protein
MKSAALEMSSQELFQTFVRRLARMFCGDPWQVIIIDIMTQRAPCVRLPPTLAVLC